MIDCDVTSAARQFERDRDDDASLARDRVDVRLLTSADESAVARIDRHLTGYDRTEYLDTALREALEASAVRVSLSARVEGVIAGYAMARTDLGDYGRTEPVAVLDTIGVDPAFARRGVGAALLSQLLVNLSALRVERVETVVARENFDLLSFLYRAGFGPSQRLAFERPA
ncbi:MAG: GNAT family N-acetyltransferase [Polyangiales bacterium]